jgi:hypothetical protein
VVSLTVVFYMYVLLFAIIGAMRGWAKEILVTFSVVLALFLITVLETYVGVIKNTIVATGGQTLFWMRATIVILLVFFGYQSPNLKALSGARFAREHLQDVLLGFIIGGLNGYLAVGTLWWFLNAAAYPFPIILPPQPNDPYYQAAVRLINILPPQWLTIPWIYFAVGLAFMFVIVVFI